MDVSFIRVMRKASYMDLKDRGELVPGGIYFVTVNTSPLIFSIIRANTETEDEVVMKNSIATKPILDNDGQSLLYYDAGGNQQKIVLSGITIGDRRSANPLPLSIDGVPIEGQLMDSDTISQAMAKLYNAIGSGGSGGSSELVKAMIRLKGYVGTQEDIYMKKSCVTGSAFINTNQSPVTYGLRDKTGSFKTFNVWPGDMLVVVNDNISGVTDKYLSALTVGWVVLHTGDSLTQALSGLSTGSGSGKILTAVSFDGGVVTATYKSMLDVILAQWEALTVSGDIESTDTLKTALSRLQTRIKELEVQVLLHQKHLTWVLPEA